MPSDHVRWKLTERRLLNGGSPGDPVFLVAFETVEGMGGSWQAGDVVAVDPWNGSADVAAFLGLLGLDAGAAVFAEDRQTSLAKALAQRNLPRDGDAMAHCAGLTPQVLVDSLPVLEFRDYSVASVPGDGRVEVLVRQTRGPDGRLGIGSGWLGTHAPVGEELAMRLRVVEDFHGPSDDRPMILIGNGTGMAGLRAHLKERATAGHRRNWLLFGERTRAFDYHFRADIEAWQASGFLSRVDLAFSRDQPERVYVQHRLREAAPLVRTWIAQGACVYVCGALIGMAADVDATLVEIVGAETVDRLRTEGAYRRDVY